MNECRQAWHAFWLASAAVFMVSLDSTVVIAAFPVLQRAFAGRSAAELSWTINAYTIVFAALLVPFGRMVDQLGHRRCFLLSMTGFTLASLACALAPGSGWLISARVFQAIAAAMLSPASLSLILAAFPKEMRSRSAALWSAVGALAAASGPVFGSLLIEWSSWQIIFLLNLPIGFAVVFFGLKYLPELESKAVDTGFDVVGSLLIVLGLGGLAAGLSTAGELSLHSVHVTGTFLLGVVILTIFPFWAKQRRHAALDVSMFDQPVYRWASFGTLVLGISFGLMFLTFYLFFTEIWHFTQSGAGWAATPGPMLATIVSVVVSKRLSKWGFRNPLLLGGLLFAASNAWLALRLTGESAYLSTWLPGQISGGIAIGLMMPVLAGAAVSSLQAGQLGAGSAANSAIRQLGTSLGVALAVALCGNLKPGLEPFRAVYLILFTCGLVIAATSRRLPRRTQA
jgi:EmrB/QacA subfamily drug resistance transporter